MPPVHINSVAVIVAAIINFAIGALWYSPVLFAKPWMKAVGKKMDEMGKPGPEMLLPLVGALLEAYVLAHFVSYTVALNAMDGARVGLWIAIGFILPVIGAIAVFEKKGLNWFLITLGYHALALMAMGALLASWV